MSKMNPEIKAKWVAALRSGEYVQTQAVLRTGDGFCCLGVLCDLYDKEGWGKEFFPSQGIPPDGVREWAGFPVSEYDPEARPTPAVVIDGVHEALYTHNDKGCTFAEIADAIEKQL